MEGEFRYRGRVITAAEVEFIRQLIAQHPGANRRQLSLRLCEAWGWRQANGALRDMVCRGLLLELARAGHLELPSATHVHRNPIVRRATSGQAVAPLLLDTTPLEVSLRALRPLEFQQVRRTPDEPLFNYLVAQYHPLGYARPVGEHLKYLVSAAGRVIACLAWSSAPRHLSARDRFIGWSAEARRRNIRFLAYNPRYLILPWVRVPHLASHVLGQMARRIAADWERMYGHPDLFSRDLRRSRTLPRHLLSGGQLGGDGADDGAGKKRPDAPAESFPQGGFGVSAHAAFSPVADGGVG